MNYINKYTESRDTYMENITFEETFEKFKKLNLKNKKCIIASIQALIFAQEQEKENKSNTLHTENQ